jgi:hypothetical protein
MTKAVKAVSRVAATRKARAPLTLNISDDVRSVLAAREGLLAAEAEYSAAVHSLPLRSKKRAAVDTANRVAREAYRLHVTGIVEKITGAPAVGRSRRIRSADDLLTLAVIDYLGFATNNGAHRALVGYLVEQAGGLRQMGGHPGTLAQRRARAA